MSTLGRIAYEAYGNAVHWKNHLNREMPSWEALPDYIRDAWEVAALAARMSENA